MIDRRDQTRGIDGAPLSPRAREVQVTVVREMSRGETLMLKVAGSLLAFVTTCAPTASQCASDTPATASPLSSASPGELYVGKALDALRSEIAELGTRIEMLSDNKWGIRKELYAAIGALLGALIGAGGGVTGSILATRAQTNLEDRKINAAREDVIYTQQMGQLTQLSTDIASTLHSMAWVTWAADQGTITLR